MQVDVGEEEDACQGVVTAGLSVLVLGVETRLDAALLQMTRLPWASLESVCSRPSGALSLFMHLRYTLAEKAPLLFCALRT